MVQTLEVAGNMMEVEDVRWAEEEYDLGNQGRDPVAG